MADTLEDHKGKVSIGGRTITNLHFADDIGGQDGQEQVLVKLAKAILQGTVQGGRQRKRLKDNTKEWNGLEWNSILRKAENCEEWRKLVVKSAVVPQRSARLHDRRR